MATFKKFYIDDTPYDYVNEATETAISNAQALASSAYNLASSAYNVASSAINATSRKWAPAYDTTTTYDKFAFVTYNNKVYRALKSNVKNVTPGTDSSAWVVRNTITTELTALWAKASG